ncbi:patatin-like phospholipase family protein [Leptospira alstonii]|uniref:Phospholipase, patatin family n=2 Tax=Leptospira alstonii TaxID=28452 RepID=M6CNA2_9LEPT|nr:patatin-like phospholipase family protein [Leptospira alstonii]EMJ93219.1 phospholipase, patatin family [Leptospira alstonii serovar Sichuan str. 79601]EQA78325.1 phospholipase, patatin family [Leptospira alstonii serovar Pingchang str. 80-412]
MKIPAAKGSKRALLVEGGGMKGAFAGGALHSLHTLVSPKHFDLVVAVSSGACSAAYYVTMPKPEPEKSLKTLAIWYMELAGRKLISPFHPFQGKTFLDQEYLVDDLFGQKYPLPAENFEKFGLPELRIAVSNLQTRTIEYVQATTANIFDLLKAATSLPIATRGRHKVDGKLYSDAAVLNPLPLEDLIEAGYKDITVVLNSPVERISPPFGMLTSLLSFPKDWKMAKLMNRWHHHHFNIARAVAQKPPKGVRIHTISPENPLPVSLVTTNANKLKETVNLGVSKGEEIGKRLLKLFSKDKNGKKVQGGNAQIKKQVRLTNPKKKSNPKRKKTK